MHGDFSRDTFDAKRHFSRVLFQQGRVVLDADPNEQTSILLHYLRTLARDIIGSHGMLGKSGGFAIGPGSQNGGFDLTIGPGHYYVDGILCENEEPGTTYSTQRDLSGASPDDLEFPFLAYLDVWERFVPSWEDGIREKALGSVDTAARAQVVWQVKVTPLAAGVTTCQALGDDWAEGFQAPNRGHLRARIARQEEIEDPCKAEAGAAYRGVENQLYRVEIHKGGEFADQPTFKWSRDNGAMVYRIRSLSNHEATLESLGEDTARSLRVNDWVEVLDDELTLQGKPGAMAQVEKVNPLARKVTLRPADPGADWPEYEADSTSNPVLRRWDHRAGVTAAGTIPIVESDSLATDWQKLEDDLEVQFVGDGTNPPIYRSGDYWLIPARVVTAGIEWPQGPGSGGEPEPLALAPHGIEHHYAPLAVVTGTAAAQITSCRRCIDLSALLGNCT